MQIPRSSKSIPNKDIHNFCIGHTPPPLSVSADSAHQKCWYVHFVLSFFSSSFVSQNIFHHPATREGKAPLGVWG